MDQFLAQVRAFAAKNGFSMVVAGVALVTVLASAWVARPARKQKAALAAESAQLEAVIKSSDLWVTQFQPASNEESAIWQNTATAVDALGVKPSERLTLAQYVLRTAEDAGLYGAHIKILPADVTPPPRVVAGATFTPSASRLQINGAGGMGALGAFIGSLPPAVELENVSMSRDATTLNLSYFEPAGTNAK